MADPPSSQAAERSLLRVERAVRELFAALSPLRGWTLVGIEAVEVVDHEGITQRIEYIDYTGPSERGSPQRITVTGFLHVGRFAYLVRWNERLAIALEPFVRYAYSAASGRNELLVAAAPISEPGSHRYRCVAGGQDLELPVTVKQLRSRR